MVKKLSREAHERIAARLEAHDRFLEIEIAGAAVPVCPACRALVDWNYLIEHEEWHARG